MCGGSLVAANMVVSAAHCVLAADRVIVAYGTNVWSSNTNLMNVSRFVAHPNYNPNRSIFDKNEI